MSEPPAHFAASTRAPWLRLFEEAVRDRYFIQEQIGSGAMGFVLKARDLKHHRAVAIKVLRADVASSIDAERFHREIRTAAGLTHPNIVSIFDSGEAAGLLYFVMPLIEGESLRARLQRDGRLEIAHALRIADQVAGALKHAHSRGVVHRDIKPENVLLSDGHALLVDFGVARVAQDAPDGRLTTTGTIVGSPHYVSPEQVHGASTVDARADIYGVGCLLYEMLAGEPPFPTTSLAATLLGHMTQDPPLVRRVRPEVAVHLEQLVIKALAKNPDDRFQSAEDVQTALHGAPFSVRSRLRVPAWAYAGLVVLVVLPIVALTRADGERPLIDVVRGLLGSSATPVDTMRYAVLPFDVPADLADLRIERRLSDALAQWRGIEVVEATTRREAGSGRVITGSVDRIDGQLRVYAELHDSNRPKVTLARARHGGPTGNAADIVNAIVNELVLRGVADECRVAERGTRSMQAITACSRGFSRLSDGDVQGADSAFVEALQADAQYARAALWLAMSRSWIVANPVDVTAQLRTASMGMTGLTDYERVLLSGYTNLAAHRFSFACRDFADALHQDSARYEAWLGAAECRARDRVVMRDPATATGWRFRSSYAAAIAAYQRAFELHPALLAGYRDHSFYAIRSLLLTGANHIVRGHALNREDVQFVATPDWRGDSLELRPHPADIFQSMTYQAPHVGVTRAVDRQRDLLRRIARNWAETQPRSAPAREALSVSYELAGEAASIAAIRQARALAVSDGERLRLAAAEVWLRLKFGLSQTPAYIDSAAVLADSLMSAAQAQTPQDAMVLAPIAVLTGRAGKAAQWARQSASLSAHDYGVPTGVAEPANALLVFSALGQPVDSITRVEQQLESAIRNAVSSSEQSSVRGRLVTRSVMLAFPDHRMNSMSAAAPGAFIDAERSFAARDIARTRGLVQRISEQQRPYRPADLTSDGVFITAWLHNQLGDSRTAAEKLDAHLGAAAWFPPARLNDVANAGALVRTMILRSQIAAANHDPTTAGHWSAIVHKLWNRSDPDLHAFLRALPRPSSN